MRNLAEYVLQKRRHAVLLALLFTFIPLMGWVSDAIMALVTLRKGAKEGAIVLLWITLPYLVLAFLSYPTLFVYAILGGSCVVFLSALILRSTHSWGNVLQYIVIAGIIVVAIVHIFMPEYLQQIAKNISTSYHVINKHFKLNLSQQALQQTIDLFSKFAFGLQVTVLFLGDLFSVAIARWAQSMLYNPNGLRDELLNLRLSLLPIILLFATLVFAIMGNAVATDCLPVVIFPFILTGLSLLHSLVNLTKISKFWLIGFYILLMLFFIYVGILLVLLAMMDYWFDFRARLQSHTL
jgi:hypothetical protein